LEAAIDRFIQVALQRAGGNVFCAARLLNVPGTIFAIGFTVADQ